MRAFSLEISLGELRRVRLIEIGAPQCADLEPKCLFKRHPKLLRPFRSVLGSSLFAVLYSRTVQCSTDDVVAYPWKVGNTAPAHQHDAVLLEVVAFSRDVGDHFLSCRQLHPSYFSQRRVRLLRSLGFYLQANASSLRAFLQSRGFVTLALRTTLLSKELLCRRHCFSCCSFD
jgi:hypothetical protein